MGGCDKTTPALMMGAFSMNLPAIFLPAGPMLRGDFQGRFLGSGSDTWKYWAELRAGTITEEEWQGVEDGIARSPGHCMTMGTASTMTSAMEVLGLALPGSTSIPAPDSRHAQMATAIGKRIVDLVWEDVKPLDIATAAAFDNAVTTVLGLGGSTNALVHLVELARRRAAWRAPEPHYTRGFGTLYLKHVTQADQGCDFDFLEAGSSDPTPEPEIH
jgi:dihydroxy-acid dehydratase